MKKKKLTKYLDVSLVADTQGLKQMEDKPDGYIAGWASTPHVDHAQDMVEAGAFQESISKRGLTGPKSIKLLLNHSARQVAGVIKVLEYREDKLWIEAQLNLEVSYVKDLYAVAKDVGFNFSVGFFTQEYTIVREEGKDTIYKIHKGDLFEVSIVPFPMNEEATVLYLKELSVPEEDQDLAKMLVMKRLVPEIEQATQILAEIRKHMALTEEQKALEQEEQERELKALSEIATREEEQALEAAQAKALQDLTLVTKFHPLLAKTAGMKAAAS